MTETSTKAIIIGGGIGGFTAALSLLEIGCDVQIYEQAAELSEIGAGLQVSPNAARVFEHLGVGPQLKKCAVLPVALESRKWDDGSQVGEYPVNSDPPQYGASHYLLYRSDLLQTLADATPSDIVHFNKRAVRVEQDAMSATVFFDDDTSATGDFVIAADGIHSVIRELLIGPDEPTFSGTVAYRGTIPAAEVADLNITNTSTKWWGPIPEHHLVHYYMASGDLFNVVGIIPEEDWTDESWTAKGEVEDFQKAFADYHAPVPEIVAKVKSVLKFAIFDRPPLDHWTEGRVALLGDAAHAMVPYMAQGAAMAIEDSAILGRIMEGITPSDVPAALLKYDSNRRERTTRMQIGSRNDTSASWPSREWIYGYDVYAAPLAD